LLIFKAAWRQQDCAVLAGDDRPGSDLTGIPRWRVAAVEADQMGGTNSQQWALGGRDGSPPCTTPNAARSGGLRGLRWAAGAGAALRGRPGAIGQRVAASAGGRAISAVVRRRRVDGDFSKHAHRFAVHHVFWSGLGDCRQYIGSGLCNRLAVLGLGSEQADARWWLLRWPFALAWRPVTLAIRFRRRAPLGRRHTGWFGTPEDDDSVNGIPGGLVRPVAWNCRNRPIKT
jgi:hypothetical protein